MFESNEIIISQALKYKISFFDNSCFVKRNEESSNVEAATGGVLHENVLLEISQNSQESTCVRVSFLIKLQAWDLQLY